MICGKIIQELQITDHINNKQRHKDNTKGVETSEKNIICYWNNERLDHSQIMLATDN